jgi:hypothetical protein
LAFPRCTAIVKQSGGSIWIDSKPGRGNTFYLALPTAEASGQAAQAELVRPQISGTETVLLVEDELRLRQNYGTVFSGMVRSPSL